MDLQDKLRQLFPDHVAGQDPITGTPTSSPPLQHEPLICKYEKRHGKPVTIVEGFQGSEDNLKELTRTLKTRLGVGGSFRDGDMLIQGDYRDKIMAALKEMGFKVKRVGG